MSTITLALANMSCGGCVGRVKAVLQQVNGVQVESVTVGSATVRFDPATTTPETIARALDTAGYPVRQTVPA